ncbi:hypothetical protein E1B28_003532 [Marasmius oreades]|uniref:MICOS complex subunit n=1 Tax=Marasmius oreades TaxID=181124 RepID=A0A9P7RLT7_9AGAR|nr:uncharacterized protein E1B28_003532 [Marasmius oreades]KAG7086009.1 hypothetical protein E1B28_003532 [Marasmius oreades]
MNPSRFRLPRGSSPRSLLLAAGAAAVLVSPREQEKLPIYPQPDPEIILQEIPSELERQIGIARRTLHTTYKETHSRVQGVVSKWIGVEHAIENRIKSIKSPQESLTPGILYIGIATLTASIISRPRSLPIRFLLPPTFFVLSMNQFLPKTTSNLGDYLGSLEHHYFPTLAEKHAVASAHTAMTWERMKSATRDTRERVHLGVESGVEKVQEVTGLKLKETLGWGKRVSGEVEGRVVQAVHAVENKVEEVKVVTEKRVDEVVEKTEKKAEEVKKLV